MATERNNNMVPSLQVKSNAGDNADVILWADPTTHRILVDATLTGGGTSMTDDAAFTVGTTAFTPVGGTYKSTRDSVDDNDGGAFAMTIKRAMYVSLETPNGDSVLDDTNDAVKVVNATAANLNVTEASAAAIKTAVELIDDTVIADDAAFTPASTKVHMVGFEFDDSSPDSVDEGDAGAARMSSRREVYMQIRDAAGNERGANVNASGQLAIAGPVTNAGTFAVQVDGAALTALQLIDDVIFVDDAAFTPGTSKIAMIGAEYDDSGTDSVDEGDAGAVRMSANRNLFVRIRDNAGNERGLNIDANGALASTVTNATASNLNAQVVGEIAHDAADSGNPQKIGGQARTTNPTAVADADRANFICDDLGKQVVVGSIRDLKVMQQTTITSSTSETTVLSAVASTFLDVYGVIATNTSATGCGLLFKDATSGTERFRIWVPATETRGFMLPESGGHVQATVNNNWTVTCSASVASIYITMFAVKNI